MFLRLILLNCYVLFPTTLIHLEFFDASSNVSGSVVIASYAMVALAYLKFYSRIVVDLISCDCGVEVSASSC